jgi:bifunctional non-homologous end joining protein LigD
MSGNRRGGNGLETYRAMRDASRTPEPFGGRAGHRRIGEAAGAAALFAVHKHAARRTHYDLRLEIDGVLVSWALPRGPTLDPAQKRLAVHVEDHPLEYAAFEGVIPDGNYGAGATILWDTGVWVPAADPRRGLEEGKLELDLHGYKLRGRFTLVHTGKGGAQQWLLIKKPDAFASQAPDAGLDEASVLSGLTVEELAAGSHRAEAARARLAALGAPRGRVALAQVAPMLCETAAGPFSDPGWVFELKYDGYRLIAGVDAGQVALRYRSGLDATALFPELTRALAALPVGALVLDGEVVALDTAGRPMFQSLQTRNQLRRPADIQRSAALTPVSYMVFDLLACEGYDLRPLRLSERKEVLRRILPGRGPVRFADHIAERGEELFARVLEMGLEGVVAKRADAPYQGARSEDWLKIRKERTGDFAVVGYTSPRGSRAGFGSLHLAAWDGRWVYVGRVGTGFDAGELARISGLLAVLPAWTPDFAPQSSPGRSDHWVEPRLVCAVAFQDVSRDGRLRAPRFLHLRDDKAPRECGPPGAERARAGEAVAAGEDAVADEGAAAGEGVAAGEAAGDAAAGDAAPAVDGDAAPAVDGDAAPAVAVSNADKPFWPGDDGTPRYTKGDLVGYYRAIAPWLLPYLRDRPVALVRYPDGITGHAFFQKDAPAWVPDWLRTATLWSKHAEREVRYFVCDSAEALAFLANLGAIPLHVWSSRIDSLGYPDWSILDLDPKEAPFVHVVEIARAARALCDELELPSFVKTSGATGLHVLIPLHGAGACTHEQSRDLAHLLARVIAAEHPDIATTARRIEQRRGRVYLDYVQNGHGRLLVAPFSVRPLPGAPVSMPLRWSEVTPRLDVTRFTMAKAVRRMQRLGEDPLAGVLDTRVDLARALALLEQRMRGRG